MVLKKVLFLSGLSLGSMLSASDPEAVLNASIKQLEELVDTRPASLNAINVQYVVVSENLDTFLLSGSLDQDQYLLYCKDICDLYAKLQ